MIDFNAYVSNWVINGKYLLIKLTETSEGYLCLSKINKAYHGLGHKQNHFFSMLNWLRNLPTVTKVESKSEICRIYKTFITNICSLNYFLVKCSCNHTWCLTVSFVLNPLASYSKIRTFNKLKKYSFLICN